MKTKLNKIKGFTLIEVLVYISIFSIFSLILFMQNKRVGEDVKDISIVNDISSLVNAIDRRVFIEGLQEENWTETEWDKNNFRDFLKKELITAENTQCGVEGGWSPRYNEDISDSLSKELGDYNGILTKTLGSKLIPCTFWNSYPLKNFQPSLKVNISDDFVKSFVFNISFSDNESWFESLVTMRKLESSINNKKINTSMLSVEFKPKVNSVNTTMENCLSNKSSCSYDIVMNTNSVFHDTERLRIDSSNSLKSGIKFAKNETTDEQLRCETWIVDDNNKWSKSTKNCGLSGGSMDSDKFIARGSNSDVDSIKLNVAEDCIIFNGESDDPKLFTQSQAACGIFDDGKIILNLTHTSTEMEVVRKLRTVDIITSSANVSGILTAQESNVIGRDKHKQTPANPRAAKEMFKKVDIDSRVGLAGYAIEVDNNINFRDQLIIGTDLHLEPTSNINTNKINIRDTASFNNLSFKGNRFETDVKVLGESHLGTINSLNKIYDGEGAQAPNLISNRMQASSGIEAEKLTLSKVMVSTGYTEIDSINAKSTFETEQLEFNKTLTISGDFNIDNSLSLDGTGPQYKYKSTAGGGLIDSWGAFDLGISGPSSLGGFSADRIEANGNLLVNTYSTGNASLDRFGGFFVTDTNIGQGNRLLDVTDYSLFSLRQAASRSGDVPIFVGKIFIGNPLTMKNTTFSNPLVNQAASGSRDLKFVSVTNMKDSAGNVVVGSDNDLTNRNSNVISVESFEIDAPNGTVQILQGAALPCWKTKAKAGGGTESVWGVCPDKLPIMPNGSKKPINYTNDTGSADKSVWILNNNIALYSQYVSSEWVLSVLYDVEKRYKVVNQATLKDGVTGDRGDRGNNGAAGIQGPVGAIGLDGPVGPRGGDIPPKDKEGN